MTDEPTKPQTPLPSTPFWSVWLQKLVGQKWLQALRGFPVVAMFAQSRLLALSTLILGAISLAPLFATPFLPLVDLGSNVGAAMLLNDAAWGDGVVATHYRVQPTFVPYWTGYLALAALEPIFGVLWATKLVIGVIVLLLPIATMRLLVALGRSPLLGLWAFMLTWDTNLFWGWFTFQLGMSLALLALAWVIEMKSWEDAGRVAVLGVVIAATHIHSLVFAAVIGGLITLLKRPLLPALARATLGLSGFVVPLLPWLLHSTESSPQSDRGPMFAGKMHDLSHKLASLHEYSLNNIPEEQWLTVFAVLLILLAPALLSAAFPLKLTRLQKQAPIAILLGSVLLYLALPFEVHSPVAHYWTYPRFATYVLLALLLVPRVDFSGLRFALLAPGIVLSVWIHFAIFKQFTAFSDYAAPYLNIIGAIEKNSRLLPLDLDKYHYKGTYRSGIGQLHGYSAAMTSSYDAHLFDNRSNPLLFRRGRTLPHPDWRKFQTFTMKSHGKYYDYIIVHPVHRDPFTRRPAMASHVKEVITAGQWRLYKVKRPENFLARNNSR